MSIKPKKSTTLSNTKKLKAKKHKKFHYYQAQNKFKGNGIPFKHKQEISKSTFLPLLSDESIEKTVPIN